MRHPIFQAVIATLSLILGGAALAAPPPPPPALQMRSVASTSLAGCEAPDIGKIMEDVGQRAAQTGAPGVAIGVYCRGEPLYVGGFGKSRLSPSQSVHTQTVFRLASITKPVTAALILKLEARGALKLSDTVSAYLPGFPGGDRITLYHLLTHTSGLADFTEDATYPAHKARPHTTAQMLAWIRSLNPPTRFAPGEGWAYSNSGYVLLGAVIEKVTGLSLAQAYVREFNLDRWSDTLGLDDPAAPLTRSEGPPGLAGPERAEGYRKNSAGQLVPAEVIDMSIPGAAGGLRGTAREYAALMDMLFRQDWAARMGQPGLLADGRPNRWGMPKEWREGLQADYGLGVFVDDRAGRRRWWHTGDIDGFHSFVAHYPADQLTVVILRNGENGDPMETEIQTAVLKALGR